MLWAMLALGLLAALYSAALRIQADAAYRDVMVLVDWHDLNGLGEPSRGAKLTDLKARELPWQFMDNLPGAYLSYSEETVGNLVDEGILRPAPIVAAAPTYEVVMDQYADDIAKGAARHGYPVQRDADTQGKLYVQFPAVGEAELPLCWRSDIIGLIKSHGIPLILRPGGSDFMDTGGLHETLAFCKDQPLVLFAGTQVLGYPDQLGDVARQLVEQDQLYGWVEFDDQDGGAALASRLAPANLVRVHSISADEMEKYSPASAVDRYLRAARERSIRCLYLRPFTHLPPHAALQKGDGGTPGWADGLATLNFRYARYLSAALAAEGFHTVARSRAPSALPPALLRFLLMLAGSAGILWLLLLWFPAIPARWWPWLTGLSVAGSAACLASHKLFELGLLKVAIAFPLLGLWLGWTLYQCSTHDLRICHPRRLGAALLALLIASAWSADGGLLIHGGLWDAKTMLKVGQFHGVTIALAAPALLLAMYAWQGESLQDAWDSARRALTPFWTRLVTLWTSPVRYGDFAFMLIAVAALALVVLRSGNDSGVGAGGLETHLRGTLEHIFSVRPRTKELLGHPALVLFFLSLPWRSRLAGLLALAGLLGQVSILNTFCHLHTPLALTLHREGLGLAIGLVTSALAGAVALFIAHLWRRRTAPDQVLPSPTAAP